MSERAIDIRRVARTLTLVENRRPEAEGVLREAYRLARHIPVLGVTGPPGAGKSTLVDRLAVRWAEAGERVAVIAVDPSSPHTGGAVLGDRFRMDRASAHERVFVRSLSARGHVGGLSRAVQDVVTVLAALEFDRVIVETVGSGQADVEVALLADCVAVVTVPGLGDQIQASKAGILEIGDVYAVNKQDLPGAGTAAGHLEANLDLIYPGRPGLNASGPHGSQRPPAGNPAVWGRHGSAAAAGAFWRPPVLRLSARDGAGVEALAVAVDEFLAWQRHSGRTAARRTERFQSHILRLAFGRLLALQAAHSGGADPLGRLADAVASGSTTPDRAVDTLLGTLFETWRRQAQAAASDPAQPVSRDGR